MKFTIRRGFLIPLTILVIEVLILLGSCIILHQPLGKTIILGVMIVPILILLIECLFRQTIIDDNSITSRKFLRSKQLPFSEITAMETILIKKRAFITLSAGDDFLILSNAYADFPALATELSKHIPNEVISPETMEMIQNPPSKSTDIISCWLGVIFLAFILYSQLQMMM